MVTDDFPEAGPDKVPAAAAERVHFPRGGRGDHRLPQVTER
ncbi:hypothetical protein [Halosimplex carlsbadense]|nr:hypothetical protein [Halosimplex carlsbadense]